MLRQPISKMIWNKKYRNNKETEQEFYKRIAYGLFENSTENEIHYYEKLLDTNNIRELFRKKFSKHLCSLAGRGLYGIGTGKTKQTFSNCFVQPIEKDSLEAIMKAASDSAMTMKAGGGVGYSISILRPSTVKIASSDSDSSGAVSFLKIFDATCSVIKAGGDRRGAQLCALGVWHPSIKEFIQAKRNGGLTNFNLSVFISDEFMSAVENDLPWELVFPDTTFEKYDANWDGNIKSWKDREYPVIVHETINARELFDLIMKSNYNFAEPGVLFEDTINRRNTLWYEEYIHTTNPCGEQPLVSHGSCNLGPINLSNHVKRPFSDNPEFDWVLLMNTTKMMTIALNKMIDISYFPLPEQSQEVENKRGIGIGFTGLADALAKLKIKYNSPEAVIFAEQVMESISINGYNTSADLANYFGVFPSFDEDILYSYNVSILPEWLKQKITVNGLRNSRITSIAPTGTTSLFMNNTSSGIEPIFALEYDRHIKQDDGNIQTESVENDAWNQFKLSKYYTKKTPDYFVTTNDLKPEDHINIQAVVQKWCCSAVSKTLNLPVEILYEDFKEIYWKVYNKGMKGCTTYRPNSILGSVLEIKSDNKVDTKTAKKELNEFYGVWKDLEKGNVILEDVELPSEYPMRGYKITSEGKKWYINVAFKDKKCTRPFGVFVTTNAKERAVDTFDAIEKFNILASNEGIKKELIEKNIDKMKGQTNINKLCRTIGLLLRHNVELIKIIKVLDNVQVPVSSFIFRIKKFLMQWVEEIPANGNPCPECGESVEYRDGCCSCSSCFWSKCA